MKRSEALAVLIGTQIGAGVLGLPYAAKEVGLIPSILVLVGVKSSSLKQVSHTGRSIQKIPNAETSKIKMTSIHFTVGKTEKHLQLHSLYFMEEFIQYGRSVFHITTTLSPE
ncbi:aromatic amino acid transport family protein [Thermococcus sp. PK]|uniref:aromatic amino acid transport family protein n=1 Tax=Thermococcus sp. PK TaxID=913025 RepID=UPI0005B2CB2F